ncbi:hypothetical protein A6E15_02475 [Natrinema saccharevitans]|uniref:Uncharacterized protein n=1 Tax=Natrinema saccharevitans TaxID=301967 RepID=A0A1S8AT69_9EURY|nr:hypothetical protein [Natrinema saccharevitans]OLZ39915.1 hypothetical protein A6E15_02475 [Natrinema saccharevitans]
MRTIVEALEPDVPYRVRQLFGPVITRLGRTLGQPQYRLRDTEYVGTIQRPLGEFTETLQEHGFEWDLLAWYHQPPVGSEPNGSWTYRRTLLADRQIHVILIAHSPTYIDVFAHEEYNWLRHPINHLWQVGIDRKAGSSKMRRWIERNGIAVDTKSRRRRRVAQAVIGLHKDLVSIVK